MIEVGLGHYLSLGAIIFFLGIIGISVWEMKLLVIISASLFSEPSSMTMTSKGFKVWFNTEGIDLFRYSASLYVVIITLVWLILLSSHLYIIYYRNWLPQARNL